MAYIQVSSMPQKPSRDLKYQCTDSFNPAGACVSERLLKIFVELIVGMVVFGRFWVLLLHVRRSGL